MIPLPLGDLFTLYLSLFVITLAYLWYRDERRRQSDDWTIAKERLYIFPFWQKTTVPISRAARAATKCVF